MKGNINDNPKRMLSIGNAQFLAFALQRFYASDDQRKLKLVKLFNNCPEKFDYHKLLKEVDSILWMQHNKNCTCVCNMQRK